MRVFILISLFVGLLFSSSSFDKTKVVVPEVVLKGSHSSEIRNISFDEKSSRMLTSSGDGIVKIWDIKEQELIKTLKFGGYFVKAQFASDGSKIYVYDKKQFMIYDSKSFSKLNYIEAKDFSTFEISDKYDSVILCGNYKAISYSLSDGKKLFDVKTDSYTNYSDISANGKYFVIGYTNFSYVYSTKNGSLLSKKNANSMRSLRFYQNKYIVATSYNEGYATIYNFKTSKEIFRSNNYGTSRLKSFYVDSDTLAMAALGSDGELQVINLKTNKLVGKVKIDKRAVSNYGLEVSDDSRYLAIGYTNGDFKLYILNKNIPKEQVKTKNIKEPEPKVIYKDRVIEKEKVVYKDRIVEKEVIKEVPVEVKKENQPPKLILEASTTSGVIPLKVDFTIIASDDNGIDSYYINLAGKEKMEKGTPPTTLSKTFTTAGSYKVVVAIKDTHGEVTKKQITINPREMTFSDYKKIFE